MSRGPAESLLSQPSGLVKDTAELRHCRERALQALEAEALTVLEMKASTLKTVGLDEMAAEVAAVTCLSGWLRLGHGACSD
jgi:hypothetical protein